MEINLLKVKQVCCGNSGGGGCGEIMKKNLSEKGNCYECGKKTGGEYVFACHCEYGKGDEFC